MKNLSPRVQGLIAINANAVVFGAAALYGKLDVSPFWIVAMRGAFGALCLLGCGIYSGGINVPPRSLWPTFAVTGFLLMLHWLTFFASVQLGGVAIATLTFATFPLFTVLVGAWHERRKPHLFEIISGATIIAAVALLVNPHGGTHSLWGILIGLMSGLAYAIFWHTGKELSKSMKATDISFWQSAAVFVVLLPILAFVSPRPHLPMEWLWLVVLGIVNTALMLQLYLYALKRISASTCSGFVALEPIYAILLAALFFHEPVTLWVGVSGALIIGSSLVLLRLESSP